jgi:hypothetical protein
MKILDAVTCDRCGDSWGYLEGDQPSPSPPSASRERTMATDDPNAQSLGDDPHTLRELEQLLAVQSRARRGRPGRERRAL